jgi:hypothetical protein
MSLNGSYSIQLNSTNYQILAPGGSAYSYPGNNSAAKTLPSGVTLSPVQTLSFDTMGRPNSGTTITISTSGLTRTLTLLAQTGFISG